MMGKRTRWFRLGIAWAWLALGASWAQAAPITPRLLELLASDAGVGLLSQTTAGNELTLKLLGRRLTRATELAELRLRLERPDAESLSTELQTRLEQAQSELDAQLRAGPMGLAERGRLLEDLSSRFLRIRLGSAGEIEFIAAPAAAGGGFAASRQAMEGLRLAPTSLGATLETSIPIEPGSMAGRLGGKLYDELIAIETRFLHTNGLDSAQGIARAVLETRGARQGAVTAKDMLDYVVAQRQEMAAALKHLGATYRAADPLLADTLDHAAHEVSVSQSSLRKIEARAAELGAVVYGPGASAENVLDYVHKLWGEMGELKVALRVQGLVGRGLKIEDLGVFLGKGAVADAARARMVELRPQYPQYLGKELDLIMDQGMLWGEVKNYSDVFSPEHRFFGKVLEQAQHTVEIRALLEQDAQIGPALKAIGKTIHFRIYLLGGVTESAARTLESLGYEVIGPRYLDGAAAPFAPTGWVLPASGLRHEWRSPTQATQQRLCA